MKIRLDSAVLRAWKTYVHGRDGLDRRHAARPSSRRHEKYARQLPRFVAAQLNSDEVFSVPWTYSLNWRVEV